VSKNAVAESQKAYRSRTLGAAQAHHHGCGAMPNEFTAGRERGASSGSICVRVVLGDQPLRVGYTTSMLPLLTRRAGKSVRKATRAGPFFPMPISSSRTDFPSTRRGG
jgi:hypothetical protein